MNLSKRQLDNKYVHRALTDMGAYKKNTRDLKRIFTDKSRKYKGNKILKARYVDDFKARCSALEFDEHFTSLKNTFPNGRVTKTYSIEAGDDWLQKHRIFDYPATLAKCHLANVEKGRKVTFQWVMNYSSGEGDFDRLDSISSKCNFDFFKATEDMKDKLTKWEGNYKDGFTESWDLITRYSPDKAGQGAALTETQTDKKWLKFSPNTVKNCGVAAFKVGYHATKDDGVFLDYYNENKINSGTKTKLSDHTKKLKHRIKEKYPKMEERYADEESMKILAKYMKCDIIVYSSVFKELWRCLGAPTDSRGRSAWRAPVELQLKAGHFVALVRWRDWNYQGKPVPGIGRIGLTLEKEKKKIEEKALEAEEDKVITGRVTPRKERSTKLGAWDLEASPDNAQEGCVRGSRHFQTYGLGFAWMQDGEMPYEAFWSNEENVCVQWLNYMYENCELFDGYTLYAHNGAKYDFNLLMREALLNHPEWSIDTEKKTPIEQNSAWISVTICCKKDPRLINSSFSVVKVYKGASHEL